MTNRSVVIVGAGFGGLSAAAMLARKGYETTVIERLPAVGGRAQVLRKSGFRFDMGPSWYWMPAEHDRWFSMLGERRSDYYAIQRLDPSYRVCFSADDVVDVPANIDRAASLFDSIERGSGERLITYLNLCRSRYQLAMEHFIYRNWDSPLDIINHTTIANFRHLGLMHSYHHEIRRRFHHPWLQQILEFPVVFLGSSPQRTPAIYTLMSHIDFGLGTWYPDGGFGAVVAAMRAVGEKQGAHFQLESEVTGFDIQRGAIVAVNVRRSNGALERVAADWVVMNGDYADTDLRLTPRAWRSYSRSYWHRRQLAPAVLNIYLGLDCRLPDAVHHTFFFDANWDDHFNAVYRHPKHIERPLFYLHAPSTTDPNVAPTGGEALFALIPIASGLTDSPAERQRLTDQVIDRIEHQTGMALRRHIVTCTTYSIDDFRSDFHAWQGTAFGLGQSLLQTAGFRPANRSRRLANLLFCGHYTVPGTGTTMSMISGELAAQRIIQES